jgi:hypothetical protein
MSERTKEWRIRIINQNINLPKLLWQPSDKPTHFIRVTDVQLYGVDFDPGRLLADFRSELLYSVDAARGEDEFEV